MSACTRNVSSAQCYKFSPFAKAPEAIITFGIQRRRVLAQSAYRSKTTMDRSTQSSLKDVLIYLNGLPK